MWDKASVIGIPLGTRLSAVVLVEGECHIWTSTSNRGADYKKWRGTFLRVEPNGRVTRITIDDTITDGTDEFILTIKEADAP